MIVTKETGHRIWLAHREIEVATKMLADIRECRGTDMPQPDSPYRDVRYQLGVPMGTGHRLIAVGNTVAIAVIEAHIADMQRELRVASNDALRELGHRP